MHMLSNSFNFMKLTTIFIYIGVAFKVVNALSPLFTSGRSTVKA